MKKIIIAVLWLASLYAIYLWGAISGAIKGEIFGISKQLCFSTQDMIGLASTIRSNNQQPIKVMEVNIEKSVTGILHRSQTDPSVVARLLNDLSQYRKLHPDTIFSKRFDKMVEYWYYNQSDAGKQHPVPLE